MELFSTASAAEEDLQQRMLGRLMATTNGLRSTLYSYRWKMRKTRNGTMIASLRANGVRPNPMMGWPSPMKADGMGGPRPYSLERKTGYGAQLGDAAALAGWPTPVQGDVRSPATPESVEHEIEKNNLRGTVFLAGWPTPTNEDYKKDGPKVEARLGTSDLKTCDQRLRNFALLAGWPTPNASNGSGGGQAARAGNPERSNELNDFAMLAGWPTPCVKDDNNSRMSPEAAARELLREGKGSSLASSATLAGWATPCANQANGEPEAFLERKRRSVARGSSMGISVTDLAMQARLTASGEGPIGFIREHSGWETHPASGQLNPALSRWLMGIPEIWCRCAIRASRSLKAKKRASSASAVTATPFAQNKPPCSSERG